jgi:hypothetical protein
MSTKDSYKAKVSKQIYSTKIRFIIIKYTLFTQGQVFLQINIIKNNKIKDTISGELHTVG